MKNIAVYEGTIDILIDVAADPCTDAWSVVPTSNEMDRYPISYSNCKGRPDDLADLSQLYHVNGRGLIIREATSTDRNGQPISTSGLIFAHCTEFGGEGEVAAKFLVVRSGPTCSCTSDSSSPDNVELTCSVDYADSVIHPISAIMTWYVNGEYFGTRTPEKEKDDMLVFTATSTITVRRSNLHSYQCTLTFGEPEADRYPYIATNAPEFSESCSSPCESASKEKTQNSKEAGGESNESGDKKQSSKQTGGESNKSGDKKQGSKQTDGEKSKRGG